MVRGKYDPEQFERKLPGIGIVGQVAGLDGEAHRLRNRPAQFLLAREQRIADEAGPVIEFRGGGENDAPAGLAGGFEPCKPVLEQRANSGQAPGSVQGGEEDFVYKAFLGSPEGRELKFRLGTEVRKQAALGQTEPGGERADRQPFQTDFARVGDGVMEDQRTGLGTFAHT